MSQCQYCKKLFVSVYTMQRHQKTVKACILLQLDDNKKIDDTKSLSTENELLKTRLKVLELEQKLASKSNVTNITNNISVVNMVNNITPLTKDHIVQTKNCLTYNDIIGSIEYAKYLCVNPLKDRTAVVNKHLIYKNGDSKGVLVKDPMGSNLIKEISKINMPKCVEICEKEISIAKKQTKNIETLSKKISTIKKCKRNIKDISDGKNTKFTKDTRKAVFDILIEPTNGIKADDDDENHELDDIKDNNVNSDSKVAYDESSDDDESDNDGLSNKTKMKLKKLIG